MDGFYNEENSKAEQRERGLRALNQARADMEDDFNVGNFMLDEIRPEPVEKSWDQVVKSVSEKRREKTILVILPEDQQRAFAESETSAPRITTVEKVNVKDHNTVSLEELKKEKIKQIQFLHSLAKDKKEFELLYNRFWLHIIHEKIDLNEFGICVLALRELFTIIKNPKFELKNISNYDHLRNVYLENHKYLIFSNNQEWHHLIVYKARYIEHTVTSYNYVDYVNTKFSDSELKKLLSIHFEQPSYIDKMLQWLKKNTNLKMIVDSMKTYHKNQDMFLSYNVDFNAVKINDSDSLSDFASAIHNVNAYKILTRLLQRLDSAKRQDVRKHKYLFDDYFSLCKKIYSEGLPFERLEPILRKIHTYSDASYFYNALKGIISPYNLYDIHQMVLNTKGAKVLYFNEAKQTMLVKIKNFKAMSEIGSQNWCIAKSMRSYLSYRMGFLGFGLRKFFIYYDANKQSDKGRENLRMIGLTIKGSVVIHAHDYGDGNVLQSDFLYDVVRENRKWFKGSLTRADRARYTGYAG